MPDMDGYDVLAALKGDEETKDIPVIFVSGIEGDIEEKGIELGVAEYIHKPYTPNIAKLRVKNQITILELRKALLPYEVS
jgi:PleD family two-component response regulator